MLLFSFKNIGFTINEYREEDGCNSINEMKFTKLWLEH